MKKTKEVYYCDFCGEECEHTEYVLPDNETEYATDCYGVKLCAVNKIQPKQFDLCKKCEEKLFCAIPFIKAMKVNCDGTMNIKF